ncbi:anti-sigma factor [Dactylosporangium fulvum]|uniref:Regulator of SigK n=1 Tax=Dactylosporangium fulvum TaxID=53359 RepID=A0ABY5W1J5_9ACTN|nr:anti-sigma factor [Dactylosporangium fulvum]UWP82919.1 anti-sigma factor [Dactylosporangium fulvum]
MTETVDIHALAGSYALDAVDDLERAAFDRHLRDCPSCAVEVAELRETAAWLAHPVAEASPPRLRDSVMAQIARTPQERSRRASTSSGRTTRDRLRRWGVAAVAAAVLAAGAGVGTWVVAQQQVTNLRDENARVDAVLAAADARLVSQDMGGGRVTVVVSPSRNAAVAVLDGLDSPGTGKAYQLWMIGASPRDAGLVPSGTGRVYVPFLAPTFGVTVEPSGGSDRPGDTLVGKINL